MVLFIVLLLVPSSSIFLIRLTRSKWFRSEILGERDGSLDCFKVPGWLSVSGFMFGYGFGRLDGFGSCWLIRLSHWAEWLLVGFFFINQTDFVHYRNDGSHERKWLACELYLERYTSRREVIPKLKWGSPRIHMFEESGYLFSFGVWI